MRREVGGLRPRQRPLQHLLRHGAAGEFRVDLGHLRHVYVVCCHGNCGSHLGHVFQSRESDTGERQ